MALKRLFGVAVVRLLAMTSPSPSDHRYRLPYEHGYHAGNYADVVKHAALVQLLSHMTKKRSPFVYAETHSGAGGYPLSSDESSRLAEHERGISVLLKDRGTTRSAEEDRRSSPPPLHPSAAALLEIVERRVPSSSTPEDGGDRDDDLPVIYPGSPLIASSLCRDQDSLLFCERDAGQFGLLRERLGALPVVDDGGGGRITLLRENGYKALKRFENLDPSKRALVFIDPPYQMGSDSEQIASLVGFLRTHWRSARVAIWHPVSGSNRERADRLYHLVREALDGSGGGNGNGGGGGAELLATELHDGTVGSVGTGMLLVNPPFGIDEELESLYSSLGDGLAGGRGKPEIMVRRL